jgi:hypothetical protein
MCTPQQKEKHVEMIKKLSDIIANCDNDTEFFIRLIWANEWISEQLKKSLDNFYKIS